MVKINLNFANSFFVIIRGEGWIESSKNYRAVKKLIDLCHKNCEFLFFMGMKWFVCMGLN